jgi:ankyrin repeat protein
MNMNSFYSGIYRSPIFRLAILLLVVTLGVLAYYGLKNHPATASEITEIHNATARNDLEKVQALLKTSPDLVNSKDTNGCTPLHIAVQFDCKDMAELLLAHGANVDVRDDGGKTPLFFTVNGGFTDTKIMELLLANKANINATNNVGRTALYCATAICPKEIAEFLLVHKADVNAGDKYGDTPLMVASGDGNKDVAELLLVSKADVNAKNNNGDTALHSAAFRGHLDMAELLLTNKADINAKNDDGATPLRLAEGSAHKDVADVLRQHGGTE